jgi:uncharacterized alkaline shock family protein YloU
MSTDITERVAAGTGRSPAHPEPSTGASDTHRGDPATRGHTTVAPAVVERTAGRVAAGVAGVRSGSVSTLRSWFGPAQDDRANPPEVGADANLDSGHAELRLTIGVEWPRPIVATADAVRQRVAREVERLTGVHVCRVDVEVDELPGRPAPVRVQ